MSYFLMELKPAEVEYLNNLNRCGLCDHLGAFHRDERADNEDLHCAECTEEDCLGIEWFMPAACLIDGCPCTGYK